MSIQTPTPPMPTPALRAVQSLPEPVVQLQERLQLLQHHVPAPQHHCSTQSQHASHSQEDPRLSTGQSHLTHEPFLRPQPRAPDVTDLKDTRKDILDLDTWTEILTLKKNSLYQKGIIFKSYERLDKSYIQEPSELKDLVDTTKLVQKFLPKETNIDNILDIIKRKVLKGTHLPLTIKEIQAGYLTSPYFKDLYLYLA